MQQDLNHQFIHKSQLLLIKHEIELFINWEHTIYGLGDSFDFYFLLMMTFVSLMCMQAFLVFGLVLSGEL